MILIEKKHKNDSFFADMTFLTIPIVEKENKYDKRDHVNVIKVMRNDLFLNMLSTDGARLHQLKYLLTDLPIEIPDGHYRIVSRDKKKIIVEIDETLGSGTFPDISGIESESERLKQAPSSVRIATDMQSLSSLAARAARLTNEDVCFNIDFLRPLLTDFFVGYFEPSWHGAFPFFNHTKIAYLMPMQL